MTAPEPTPVEPFSTLLTFFVANPKWRVVTCLTRRCGDLEPRLEVVCGDRLYVRFLWENGFLIFWISYVIDGATCLEKRERIGRAAGKTSDRTPLSLCHLDAGWYDALCEAMGQIVADLTSQRDGLREMLASLTTDRRP